MAKKERKKYDKILIITITSQHKNYCLDAFLNNITKITYPDVKHLIIDNSKEYSNVSHIAKIYKEKKERNKWHGKALIKHYNKIKDLRFLIAKCYEMGRQYAIKNGFDKIILIESDLFPRENVIEYLLEKNKAVIGMPYFLGHTYYSYLMEQMYIGEGVMSFKETVTMYKSFLHFKGLTVNQSHIGKGVLLIDKSVFTKISFRVTEGNTWHSDTQFHNDLNEAKIPVYFDKNYIVHHQNSKWSKIIRKHENIK